MIRFFILIIVYKVGFDLFLYLLNYVEEVKFIK